MEAQKEPMNDQTTTKHIKDRLRRYTDLIRDIENQRERLDQMEATYGSPTSPNLSGIPKAKGGITNPIAAAYERKERLMERIEQKEAAERIEREALEDMIEKLDSPDERLTIQLKYLDLYEWQDVNFGLFGRKADFIEKMDAYQRRTYRIHGRALLNLARINAEVIDSESE